MGGVLPYNWEAYCSTNGRCTVGFPFLQGLEARKVQRYKWGAYCRTNWRCTAVLSSRPVGVGVSETLPRRESLRAGHGIPSSLDGRNRQSPIASVQRMRSTLASHSEVPRGTNVKRMNANRAIRIAGSVRTNFCISGGDMTAEER